MLRRFSNRGEVYVHDVLVAAVARHDAEIYRKVRIAELTQNLKDRKLIAEMAKRTGACLEQYRNRELIKSERHVGNVVTWEIVH
jgi:hypothetical protein